MIALRNILHGYSVATRAGRLRVTALAALALVGVVGSYTLDLARSPSEEGGSADGSLRADGDSAGGGLGDGPLAQDGVGGADPGVAAGQALASQTSTGSSSRSGTGSSSGSGTAGASGGGSSSSSSTSSATSTSTSSSTSSSSSGSPTDGLAPDLGDGFGTGGLVNEDQFVNDIQQVSETVTSTASSVVGGVGGLPGP